MHWFGCHLNLFKRPIVFWPSSQSCEKKTIGNITLSYYTIRVQVFNPTEVGCAWSKHLLTHSISCTCPFFSLFHFCSSSCSRSRSECLITNRERERAREQDINNSLLFAEMWALPQIERSILFCSNQKLFLLIEFVFLFCRFDNIIGMPLKLEWYATEKYPQRKQKKEKEIKNSFRANRKTRYANSIGFDDVLFCRSCLVGIVVGVQAVYFVLRGLWEHSILRHVVHFWVFSMVFCGLFSPLFYNLMVDVVSMEKNMCLVKEPTIWLKENSCWLLTMYCTFTRCSTILHWKRERIKIK